MRSFTACDPAEMLLAGDLLGERWVEALLLDGLAPRKAGLALLLREEAAPLPFEVFFFCSAAIRSERDDVPAGRLVGRLGCCCDLQRGQRGRKWISICSPLYIADTQLQYSHYMRQNSAVTVACWRYRSCEVTLTTLFYDMPLAKYCSFLAQWQQSVPPASRGAVDIRCTTRAETELTGLYIRGWTSDDGASRRSYAGGKERLALPAMLSGKGPSRSAADSALTVIDQGPTTQWQQPT